MALRSIGVKLTADVAAYTASMRRAEQSTKSFGDQLAKSAAAGNLDATADRAALMGAAIGGALAYVVKEAAEFDKKMSSVAASTRASTAELGKLRAAAIQAGKDTKYSATEAAGAIEELAKAGVSTADILGGGLAGALSLASAGELDVAEAAETAASAMTQFKLSGDKVPHVADLLSAAAGKAQGSVHDLGYALSQSGLVASQMGLTIEDTTGTLAAFASAGLLGSDAGTSLKTALLMLANPTKEAKNLMEELGINAYDASGEFVGITALSGQLKNQLSGLTQEQRNAALATIFGADAIRAASVLYDQGADGIQKWITKTNDAGYASETAAAKTDNLIGDIERLKGSLSALAIESGSGPAEGLRVIVQGLEGVVGWVGELNPVISTTVMILGGLTGALLLGAAGWVKARSVIADTSEELRKTGPAGEKAARGLERGAAGASKAAVGMIALQAALTAIHSFGEASADAERLGDALTKLGQTGDVTGELERVWGEGLAGLEETAQFADDASHGFWKFTNEVASAIPIFGEASDILQEGIFGTSANKSLQDMKALDTALTDYINTVGDSDKANRVFMEVWKQSGLDLEEFNKLVPGASDAMTKLQEATHGNADAAKEMNVEQVALSDSISVTKEEAEKLEEQFNDLYGILKGSAEATLDAEESMAALNESLKNNGSNFDQATEKGRANWEATIDAIDAQKELRDANIASGMSVQDANKRYQEQIDKIIGVIGKSGAGKTALDTYAQSVRNIPAGVYTTVNTPGLPAARQGIKDFDKQLKDVKTRINTEVSVEGKAAAQKALDDLLIRQQAAKSGTSVQAAGAAFRKNAYGYAEGGWTGPGHKHEVAGIVHADEFVINKAARRKIEADRPGLLAEINATGQLPPGYANGGMVMPFPLPVANAWRPSLAEALAVVGPVFDRAGWPGDPSQQRGDSGVWRKVLQLIQSGPKSGSFGNAYRPGDPLWHGSGRAVDWMGYNQDALAQFLANKQPLELIHRTGTKDYAYTRGRNMGSFDNALMEAHRNHIHIAMQNGGVIDEPVVGVGASGRSYSFGESGPETVTPGRGPWLAPGRGAGTTVINQYAITVEVPVSANKSEIGREVVEVVKAYELRNGAGWRA